MKMTVRPGSPFPLGATADQEGVNFALYAENATAVELCLYTGSTETERIKIEDRTHHIWHVCIAGLKPGQYYGYRVYGPFDPSNGHRFNPNKLLLDPYAKAITSAVKWHDSMFGYVFGDPEEDLSYNDEDSGPYMPKSVVIDPAFDWENDQSPRIPYHKSIIYELHVKGFSKQNPAIPEELRGSYAALAHPASIDYFKKLGITAVELMPVQYFVSDRQLEESGKSNYWGYNTIGFFAPDNRYAANPKGGEEVNEFKNMVKELHKAGIEVILDVVYNHTGEGNQMGPVISFRGIDNASYYRLAEDKRYYTDYTGTGNTLNANLPSVLRLIMDSLRYWILEMHVDGFRFDLASTLARELHEVDRLSAFFDIIHQDPIISQVKLIAEPWDIGEGGYQVGNFPPGWAEWNGKYRDCMRDFWRGANSMLSEFASRFTGSSDLYKNDDRHPTASINFITAHDGFTLNDLVSYNEKHNEDNHENNNDGESHNRSWNCGCEGPADDPAINVLRSRQKRNFLTTLFLSQGVPMLLAGDEISKTQQGNNNAYCQDNELSWIDWEKADTELLEYTKKLIHFYRKHDVFSRRDWFKGQQIKGTGLHDIAWFTHEGFEMTEENWTLDFAKSLAVYLDGHGIHSKGYDGHRIIDDSFYIMFNASHHSLEYKLPSHKFGAGWTKIIDTCCNFADDQGDGFYKPGESLNVESLSMVLLKRV